MSRIAASLDTSFGTSVTGIPDSPPSAAVTLGRFLPFNLFRNRAYRCFHSRKHLRMTYFGCQRGPEDVRTPVCNESGIVGRGHGGASRATLARNAGIQYRQRLLSIQMRVGELISVAAQAAVAARIAAAFALQTIQRIA